MTPRRELAGCFPSSEGKASPTLMPEGSGSSSRPDRVGLRCKVSGQMPRSKALCPGTAEQRQAAGSKPQPDGTRNPSLVQPGPQRARVQSLQLLLALGMISQIPTATWLLLL